MPKDRSVVWCSHRKISVILACMDKCWFCAPTKDRVEGEQTQGSLSSALTLSLCDLDEVARIMPIHECSRAETAAIWCHHKCNFLLLPLKGAWGMKWVYLAYSASHISPSVRQSSLLIFPWPECVFLVEVETSPFSEICQITHCSKWTWLKKSLEHYECVGIVECS